MQMSNEELSEEKLLSMGLGIVPAVAPADDPKLFGYSKTNKIIQLVDGNAIQYRYDHIHEWFNTEILERTLALSPEDKDRYFQMITDYYDILQKIVNDDNNIIWEYAAGHEHNMPWLKIANHARNSNTDIDYERPRELINQYQEWRAKKGL
jgi:hypothetical protein